MQHPVSYTHLDVYKRQSHEQADATPIQRYGNGDFLFRSKVRRRLDKALAEGRTEEEILKIASCDPTIGEQSVRRLLIEKYVDVLGQMHGKLTEETLVYGSEPVRVEGGQIVFEKMRNRPFSTLAVPEMCIRDRCGDDSFGFVFSYELFADAERLCVAAQHHRYGRLYVLAGYRPESLALSPRYAKTGLRSDVYKRQALATT